MITQRSFLQHALAETIWHIRSSGSIAWHIACLDYQPTNHWWGSLYNFSIISFLLGGKRNFLFIPPLQREETGGGKRRRRIILTVGQRWLSVLLLAGCMIFISSFKTTIAQDPAHTYSSESFIIINIQHFRAVLFAYEAVQETLQVLNQEGQHDPQQQKFAREKIKQAKRGLNRIIKQTGGNIRPQLEQAYDAIQRVDQALEIDNRVETQKALIDARLLLEHEQAEVAMLLEQQQAQLQRQTELQQRQAELQQYLAEPHLMQFSLEQQQGELQQYLAEPHLMQFSLEQQQAQLQRQGERQQQDQRQRQGERQQQDQRQRQGERQQQDQLQQQLAELQQQLAELQQQLAELQRQQLSRVHLAELLQLAEPQQRQAELQQQLSLLQQQGELQRQLAELQRQQLSRVHLAELLQLAELQQQAEPQQQLAELQQQLAELQQQLAELLQQQTTDRFLASRRFAGPVEFPPDTIRAYGVVSFTSRFFKERIEWACRAFLDTFLTLEEGALILLNTPQMVTFWPLDDIKLSQDLNRRKSEPICAGGDAKGKVDIVKHYHMPTGVLAVNQALPPHAADKRGPFLIAWSPPADKGKSDAVRLVLNLSDHHTDAAFEEAFRRWKSRIENNPSLWRDGQTEWMLEDLRVSVRDFADYFGGAILQTFGIK